MLWQAAAEQTEAYHLPFSDLGLACLRRDILQKKNAEVAQFLSDNFNNTGWSKGAVSLNFPDHNRGCLLTITERCNLAPLTRGRGTSLLLFCDE